MDDSEEETITNGTHPPQDKRGRPVGKTCSTQQTRRTTREIYDGKIRIAQMKLDALREAEERKLEARKTRPRPEKAAKPKPIVQEIAMPKNKPREDSLSPSPKRVTYASKKDALYDSFFKQQRRY